MLLVQPAQWHMSTRLLIAWNVGVWLYIAAAGWLMMRSDESHLRRQAILGDESRFAVLTIGAIGAAASMVAIVAQLGQVKVLHGLLKAIHLSLAATTILSAWIFIHLTFALHYAHEYFIERDSERALAPELRGGILIPGCVRPDFSDFLYFSFVIGVACATADVNITSRPMRRVALFHCVLAFFFNTTIFALTINISADWIQEGFFLFRRNREKATQSST